MSDSNFGTGMSRLSMINMFINNDRRGFLTPHRNTIKQSFCYLTTRVGNSTFLKY